MGAQSAVRVVLNRTLRILIEILFGLRPGTRLLSGIEHLVGLLSTLWCILAGLLVVALGMFVRCGLRRLCRRRCWLLVFEDL